MTQYSPILKMASTAEKFQLVRSKILVWILNVELIGKNLEAMMESRFCCLRRKMDCILMGEEEDQNLVKDQHGAVMVRKVKSDKMYYYKLNKSVVQKLRDAWKSLVDEWFRVSKTLDQQPVQPLLDLVVQYYDMSHQGFVVMQQQGVAAQGDAVKKTKSFMLMGRMVWI